MEEKERKHIQKMFEILNFDKDERRIGIIIEKNGEINLVFSQDLKPEEEAKILYDFYEFFRKLGIIDIFDHTNTVAYIHGNSHLFIMLHALISKNPGKIYIDKKSLNGQGEQTAEWIYANKRAKTRNMELILV